jgi:hypothetical protein
MLVQCNILTQDIVTPLATSPICKLGSPNVFVFNAFNILVVLTGVQLSIHI